MSSYMTHASAQEFWVSASAAAWLAGEASRGPRPRTGGLGGPLGEELVEGPDRVLLHGGQHVGVQVERDPHARMAQSLGDDLGVDSLKQHERGVGVAKIVEPHVGKTRCPKEQPPARGERVGVKRSSVPAIDHQIQLGPRSGPLAPERLVSSRSLEEGPKRLWQLHGSPGPPGLRLGEGEATSGDMKRAANLGTGEVGVKIRPAKREDLASAHPGRDRNHPGKLDRRAFERGDDPPRHRLVDHDRLGSPRPRGLGSFGRVRGADAPPNGLAQGLGEHEVKVQHRARREATLG